MTQHVEPTIKVVTESVENFAKIKRYLTSENTEEVVTQFGSGMFDLVDVRTQMSELGHSEDAMISSIVESVSLLEEAAQNLWRSAVQPEPFFPILQSCRVHHRVLALLYPWANSNATINQLFLNEIGRRNEELKVLLESQNSSDETGLIHFRNEREEKGGYSIYVPEYYDPAHKLPLVLTLHGGSGHGRSHIWTWLRDARSCGFILMSPTSTDATWSLFDPEFDLANLLNHIEEVSARWAIDESRILMSGMSDGGTFALVSGFRDDAPFSHLAPCSASFHPMLVEMVSPEKLKTVQVYLLHGTRDWMFPVDMARMAHVSLEHAGVDIRYREIYDLAHAYPEEENAKIVEWFTGEPVS